MKTENLTLKDQVREMQRCIDDPIYFFKTYMYVQNPVRGPVLFDPYPYQEKTLNNYHTNPFNITRSARQMGTTTMTAARVLWLIVTQADENIIIASYKHTSAREILSRVRYAMELLPNWLCPGIEVNNKSTLEFDNGMKVRSVFANSCSVRGHTINHLFWDNASWVSPDVQEEFWMALLPSLSTGGTAVVSTSGTGRDIREMFNRLWNGGAFVTNRLEWSDHPYRDEAFRKDQIKIIGERKWLEEYECLYVVSV
jgi:hypothetical protein